MSKKTISSLVTIAILLVWGMIFGFPEPGNDTKTTSNTQTTQSSPALSSKPNSTHNNALLADSYKQKKSKIWMEVKVKVTRLLADDNDGSRHQKFIVESASGLSVLVSHNIDLADRVPVSRGDEITLRGRYEWSDRGGVLHWTHHDPRGNIEGGWIKFDGQTYH